MLEFGALPFIVISSESRSTSFQIPNLLSATFFPGATQKQCKPTPSSELGPGKRPHCQLYNVLFNELNYGFKIDFTSLSFYHDWDLHSLPILGLCQSYLFILPMLRDLS